MVLPEQAAREHIDAALEAAGWRVQDLAELNLGAGRGIAVREFPLAPGHGEADYLLYVEGRAVGAVEAKKEGATLTGVEPQSARYAAGLPDHLPAPIRPLPFLYQSTGSETRFTNGLDPDPRSRPVFHFHKPETLAAWLDAEPVFLPMIDGRPDPRSERPATLRARLQTLPELDAKGLWRAQAAAVRNLELSLRHDRPRALIQMATGSGKTFAAVTSVYRLVKYADASRILFLVDRDNLGKQAEKEFQQYTTPDDGRKFTELYNVQRLRSNRLDPVARVVITTIQRLYSMLKGEPDLDPSLEQGSQFDTMGGLIREPVPVVYTPALPIETFDAIFVDECHRSIYSLWRQVLEYFDAYLVGLTATPSKQTLGFFRQNLVMEYGHAQAVADRVNVDYDVYRIRTRITEGGSTLEAGPGEIVGRRDRATRKVRWETLDEDLVYDAEALDRQVVAPDQIRTVVRAFRDRLFTEIFPGRKHVPKTLVFAKDDSHADDVVQIIREEFGKGNDFCQKITYRTSDPETVLADFRTRYHPRIAVTVDMIATGTDVRPLEIVMFMRAVRSRNFFEQMKGRGVRVIDRTDLQSVTPDADGKDRFVLIDCVGVCEQDLSETMPLERKRGVSLEKLLTAVAGASTDPEILSSLAGRLARIDRRIGPPDRQALADLSGGQGIGAIASALVEALDPDLQVEEARRLAGLPAGAEPSGEQVAEAARTLLRSATAPIATNPELRSRLVDVQRSLEQTLDDVSRDEITDARFAPEIKERIAERLVRDFEEFLAKHRDEITALQVLYSRPYRRRLTHDDIRALADAVAAPPRRWTPDLLWRAYEELRRDRVRGASSQRLLTDLVSLVRFAIHHDPELVPYGERVRERFETWLLQQANQGRRFTDEQRQWLEAIRDHVAANAEVAIDDLGYAPFAQMGGVGKAVRVFGGDGLVRLLEEMNEVLAA
jgi:type I restriction enzyme R subunit